MSERKPTVTSSADISPCGKYRFTLTRVWDESKPLMGFIMLNPSTADENEDDPTIRKCMGFADRNDCGGIMVANLYPLRATDPKELRGFVWTEQIRKANANAIVNVIHICEMTVAAWGNHKSKDDHRGLIRWRASCLGRSLYCLRKTKSGQPWHPLYMPYGSPLEKFS